MDKKIVLTMFLAIGLFGAGIYIILQAGYLPVNELLTVEKPMGNVEVVTNEVKGLKQTDDDFKQTDKLDCLFFYDLIQRVPDVDKVKYEVFKTSTVPDAVMWDYKQRLMRQGYQVYKDYEGIFTYQGYKVYYAVYLKGITAVGIVAVSTDSCRCGSCVLYTTGSVTAYQSIYNKLVEQYGDLTAQAEKIMETLT